MQKNIVSSVNKAMAEAGAKKENRQNSNAPTLDFASLREELDSLKKENVQFAAAVDEMKAQNEELRNKLEQLISSQETKPAKKKKSKKKN